MKKGNPHRQKKHFEARKIHNELICTALPGLQSQRIGKIYTSSNVNLKPGVSLTLNSSPSGEEFRVRRHNYSSHHGVNLANHSQCNLGS